MNDERTNGEETAEELGADGDATEEPEDTQEVVAESAESEEEDGSEGELPPAEDAVGGEGDESDAEGDESSPEVVAVSNAPVELSYEELGILAQCNAQVSVPEWAEWQALRALDGEVVFLERTAAPSSDNQSRFRNRPRPPISVETPDGVAFGYRLFRDIGALQEAVLGVADES